MKLQHCSVMRELSELPCRQNKMRTIILDAKTLGDDLSMDLFGNETVIYENAAPGEVSARVENAEVIIVNKLELGEENLSSAKDLRIICVAATGYDNIDIEYCKRRGIAVCNVKGYSTDSVAQLTVMMALSLMMHQNEYSRFVESGEYTESGVANRLTPVYHELRGKTWGVLGYGNIGKQVARVAEAFGCRVLAFKRTPDESVPCVSLAEVMEQSDIISVHLPANEETRGIISGEMIAKMKNDAIFINVARGVVVDERALCNAVAEEKIGAIGVDVYSKEPFSAEHPFCEIMHRDNVLLTPHIAWGAYESRKRCIEEIKKNIEAFELGEKRNRIV